MIHVAVLDEDQDLLSVIRQNMREEVQPLVASLVQNTEPEVQTVEDMVGEEG